MKKVKGRLVRFLIGLERREAPGDEMESDISFIVPHFHTAQQF